MQKSHFFLVLLFVGLFLMLAAQPLGSGGPLLSFCCVDDDPPECPPLCPNDPPTGLTQSQ